MQTCTIAKTSINSGRLPAVYSRLPYFKGRVILDWGCGRYTDHIRAALPGHLAYLPYDPFNQPEEVNRDTLALVRIAVHTETPVTVICSNVLNVIDNDDEVRNIANWLRYIVTETGGIGYVTVYEGDRSGTGRKTGPDQYQRNAPLRDYLKYFPDSRIQSGMIVIG